MNGASTTTRKRSTNSPGSPSTSTANNLPPPRTSQSMRDVKPPFSEMRMNRFIYTLLFLITLLAVYYSFRVAQYKTEVGGWWNMALGKGPRRAAESAFGTQPTVSGDAPGEVEDKINALAKALGMPSNELASAIAGAVRQYVPPASLSSVAAKETGTVVEALVSGASDLPLATAASEAAGAAGSAATGVVGGVVENFVGMDEP
ncbi:hypothetical protein BDQ17DRAFT_1356637 [Cyathus striatus]|nr:hypothetical protein BDQ17DRAFT_1356637 [Cyathus striatus]